MFTQLQTTLNVKLKTDFMLNKLFPNDIISDIIDLQSDNLDENENDNIDERLLKLLEDKKQINKSESFNIFKVLKSKSIKDKIYDIIKCNINLNINW